MPVHPLGYRLIQLLYYRHCLTDCRETGNEHDTHGNLSILGLPVFHSTNWADVRTWEVKYTFVSFIIMYWNLYW